MQKQKHIVKKFTLLSIVLAAPIVCNVPNTKWPVSAAVSRAIQEAYNEAHGITPESVRNAIRSVLEITKRVEDTSPDPLNEEEREALMRQIEEEMISAAKELEFERAAQLRDRMLALRGEAPMKDEFQQRRHRRKERTRKSEH